MSVILIAVCIKMHTKLVLVLSLSSLVTQDVFIIKTWYYYRTKLLVPQTVIKIWILKIHNYVGFLQIRWHMATLQWTIVMGDTIPKVSIPLIRYFQKWVSMPLTFSSDTDTITWFIQCWFSKAGELVSAKRSNIKMWTCLSS